MTSRKTIPARTAATRRSLGTRAHVSSRQGWGRVLTVDVAGLHGSEGVVAPRAQLIHVARLLKLLLEQTPDSLLRADEGKKARAN